MITRAAYEANIQESGISMAEPLGIVLVGLFDHIQNLEGTINKVGSGLSTQAEQDIAFRVVEATAVVVEREIKHISRKFDRRTIVIFIAAAFSIFTLGYVLSSHGNINDDFMAMLIKANNVAAIKHYCMDHVVVSGTHHTCQLPSVWLQ